jgi:small subunit ribosomal protein S18
MATTTPPTSSSTPSAPPSSSSSSSSSDDNADRDGDDRRGTSRGGLGGTRTQLSDEVVAKIDYKNPQILRSFVTDRGKMIPRRISGASARQQRIISTAIRRARMLALLPFSVTGD